MERKDLPVGTDTEDGSNESTSQEEWSCHFCAEGSIPEQEWRVSCPHVLNESIPESDRCTLQSHVPCFARYLLRGKPSGTLIPSDGVCPQCSQPVTWPDVIVTKKRTLHSSSQNDSQSDSMSESQDDSQNTDDLSQSESMDDEL